MHAPRTQFEPSTPSGESGVALAAVIAIAVIVGLLTVAVSMSVIDSSQRATARSERVELQPTLDSAARAYERALAKRSVNERTNFTMTAASISKVLGAGEVIVPNSSIYPDYAAPGEVHLRTGANDTDVTIYKFAANADPALNEEFTVRKDAGTGMATFWRVIRVDNTTAFSPGGKLAIYVRVWKGTTDGTKVIRDRVARVEYSSGHFSDFQTLTNSTILFGNNATINGAVHSNGTSSTPGVDVPAGVSVKATGSVNCGGATGYPITTGKGDIVVGDCNKSARTGDFIDFGRVSETFETIADGCNVAGSTVDSVHCATGTSSVRISGNTVRVTDSSGTTILSTAGGKAVGVLVDGDVTVQSTSPAVGRITIASHRSDPTATATNITITSDILVSDINRDVVGLVAQGHVVVDVPSSCTTSRNAWGSSGIQTGLSGKRVIQAALVAASGGVRIPTKWTTEAPIQPLWLPLCEELEVNGSIASHYAPILRWSWDAESIVGFANRSYTWNDSLKDNPPPFFPLSREWEQENIKDANDDCLVKYASVWSCR